MKFHRALLVVALGIAACKSATKGAETSEIAKNATKDVKEDVAAVPASAQPGECDKAPEPVVCCEALTPTCNECREQAAKAEAEWKEHCKQPAATPESCATPPVVACCAAETAECRACRETALNTLLAWQARCGDADSVDCTHSPPEVACCAAMTPACDACKDRQRRVRQEWKRRCP